MEVSKSVRVIENNYAHEMADTQQDSGESSVSNDTITRLKVTRDGALPQKSDLALVGMFCSCLIRVISWIVNSFPQEQERSTKSHQLTRTSVPR